MTRATAPRAFIDSHKTGARYAANILGLHRLCREPICRRVHKCRARGAPCVSRFDVQWRHRLDMLDTILERHLALTNAVEEEEYEDGPDWDDGWR